MEKPQKMNFLTGGSSIKQETSIWFMMLVTIVMGHHHSSKVAKFLVVVIDPEPTIKPPVGGVGHQRSEQIAMENPMKIFMT